MSSVTDVEARFSALGGVFLTPASELAARLRDARGIVLDWDGVFNSGAKGEGVGSSFSEADSMGTNLLRFALWKAHGRLPFAAIVTGEDNGTARLFARREHFDIVLTGVKDKGRALEDLCDLRQLDPRELVVVFDDVNDLGMAARCGVRIFVRRDASPLLAEHVARHSLADYMTAAKGGDHAVREAAELLLGSMSAFEQVVASRVAWDADYARYFAERQAVDTRFESAAAT